MKRELPRWPFSLTPAFGSNHLFLVCTREEVQTTWPFQLQMTTEKDLQSTCMFYGIKPKVTAEFQKQVVFTNKHLYCGLINIQFYLQSIKALARSTQG